MKQVRGPYQTPKKGKNLNYKDGSEIRISWKPSKRNPKGIFDALILHSNGRSEFLSGYLTKTDIEKDAKQILRNLS